MLERVLLPEKHAIAILLNDHDTVKELFDRFDKSDSAVEREKIIAETLTALKIHAVIEEEIFYPAVRKEVGKDLMNEADEEHHVGPECASRRCQFLPPFNSRFGMQAR